MLLKDLLCEIEYEGTGEIEVTSVESSSLTVKEGSAFVCIKGYETDGHKYAKNAAEKGASVIIAQDDVDVSCPVVKVKDTRRCLAIMCNEFYNNPSKEFKLVGITGTNGKTTTTFLIKQILEKAGQKVGLIGTNQIMIGEEIYPASRTTPDSFELQGLFRKMADSKVDTVVMEVSSHALYLDRVYGCDFDVGVFTNLTQDHLDFHKTMENYRDAKAILFDICKKGVINTDDKNGEFIAKNAKCEVMTYGIDESADINAKNVTLEQKGVSFEINDKKYSLAIPGKFSVYNALSAIGALKALGIDDEIIREGLSEAKGVRGRAEVIPVSDEFTVLVDYAHTPDGIENILKTAKGFAKGRVVILFGCGGDRDNTKRPIMGQIASSLADFCIVTSDNPRTENPMNIINEILPGVKGEHIVIENRREAIEYAIKNAQKDDVVILAGKGHEDYQQIGKEKIHFDEVEILMELKEKYNAKN